VGVSNSELSHTIRTKPSNLSSINHDGFALESNDFENFDEIETTDLPEDDMESRIWAQFVRRADEAATT
jgi:hypothetical protein